MLKDYHTSGESGGQHESRKGQILYRASEVVADMWGQPSGKPWVAFVPHRQQPGTCPAPPIGLVFSQRCRITKESDTMNIGKQTSKHPNFPGDFTQERSSIFKILGRKLRRSEFCYLGDGCRSCMVLILSLGVAFLWLHWVETCVTMAADSGNSKWGFKKA
ncbi:hypothetical protein BDZ91DRAFT_35039 [Kalaharituber pfeilii]|nr:hypothetical protein BDZ91DRAFT_35039 [Kalaharituber pfeilii]